MDKRRVEGLSVRVGNLVDPDLWGGLPDLYPAIFIFLIADYKDWVVLVTKTTKDFIYDKMMNIKYMYS